MKEKIFIFLTAILLISIFSIGFIYSEDAGIGGTAVTGETGTTGTGDASQQEWARVPRTDIYFQGQVGSNYNSDLGATRISVGEGAQVRFGKDSNSPVIKEVTGTIDAGDDKTVSGFDLTSKTGQRLEIPRGTKNIVQSFDVPERGRALYKQGINAEGKQNPVEVLVGKGDGKSVAVNAPSASNKDGSKLDSKDQIDVNYKTDSRAIKTYTDAGGTNNYVESQPQKEGLSNPARMKFEAQADGNYLAYGQRGQYVVGNKDGTRLTDIRGSGEKVYFTGDKISDGAKPGSYLAIGDKSIDYMNTKKEGMSPVVSFPGMKNEDSKVYTGLSAGPESGFKLTQSNGLTKIDYTGKLLGQVEIDGRVISSQMVDTVGLVDGKSKVISSERKVFETIGENFAPDGAKTRNVEINLGEKSIKMQTDDGKIIETNGKIVATQDGDKVRMAVVGEGEDSNKKIAQLLNHEITSGEIMDDKNRVVVNPPNPPEKVQPPQEIKSPVQPVSIVQPEPPKPPWEAKPGNLPVGDGRVFDYRASPKPDTFYSSASGRFPIQYSTIAGLEKASRGGTIVATITQPSVCPPCAREMVENGIKSTFVSGGNTYANYYITGPQAVKLGYSGGYPNKVFVRDGRIIGMVPR